MEIFVDGGLFELAIAAVFGYAINYIFRKKYMLFIFSCISILSPVALIFFKEGELYSWSIIFCIINAALLVVLLWKERLSTPGQPLFDLEVFKKKLFKKNKRLSESKEHSGLGS